MSCCGRRARFAEKIAIGSDKPTARAQPRIRRCSAICARRAATTKNESHASPLAAKCSSASSRSSRSTITWTSSAWSPPRAARNRLDRQPVDGSPRDRLLAVGLEHHHRGIRRRERRLYAIIHSRGIAAVDGELGSCEGWMSHADDAAHYHLLSHRVSDARQNRRYPQARPSCATDAVQEQPDELEFE